MPRPYNLSAEALAARKANAQKPRPGRTTVLREIMHRILDPVMAEHALPRLAAILRDPETPPDLWLKAFESAANRVGLPAVMRQEHEDVTPGREVVAVDRPIPWLEGGTDATAGDHDGRSERVPVQ